MHHIPHTWVNSIIEAGFSRMLAWAWGGGEGSQSKNWANSYRGVGLGVHPLKLDQFLKSLLFSLDTGFHIFGLKVLVNRD